MKAAILLMFAGSAIAAESLPSVSPPTDWTAVGVLALVAVLAIAVTGYILYLKRPGQQFGEEQIEAIANALHGKMNPPPAEAVVTWPMTMDGRTFNTEYELAEYKAAKAVMDKYKGTP